MADAVEAKTALEAELEKLRKSLREEGLLHRNFQRVSSITSLDDIVTSVTEAAAEAASCDFALLFLMEGGELRFRGKASADSMDRLDGTPVHRVGECLCGIVARDGRPAYSVNIHADPRCTWEECKKAGVHSFAALPLASEGRTFGVLGLASMKEHDFEEQAGFLETLAANMSVGIRNALLREELGSRAKQLESEIADRKRVDETLRQTREVFQSAFENAPVGMCLVSLEGRFLGVNDALCRFLEYSREELLSMDFGEVTHPDDLSAGKEWVDKLLAGMEPVMDFEKRYIRKSGGVVWGIVRSFLMRDAGGNPLFFIAHVQDITGRRRSEEAILAERNFANAALNSMPAIFYMFDQEGKFLRWNWNFEQATEYSPEEIARMHPLDLFLGADRALIEERIGKVFANGASDAEANLVARSGKRTPYYFTGRAIDIGGSPCLIGMGIDITERARMEEALLHSEKQFRTLLENVQLVAVMLDRDGKITYCNGYLLRLAGWSAEEVLGKSWFDLFLPEGVRESVRSFFHAGIANASLPMQHENDIVTRGGARRLIVWNNTVLFDLKGDVTGTASIGIDVTDQRNLEEQLRQSQKMEAVGQLAGGIAHDFNNLLTVIIGYSEMLLTKIGKDIPPGLEAGEIRKAALKAASLTGQLLAFSRRQILSPEVLDLNSIVRDVENMLRRIIEEHINLALDLFEDLWKVKADRSRIEQVIVNLAINAKDAMPKGGTLCIGTRNIEIDDATARDHPDLVPGEYAALSIRDTGHGMDPVTLAHIFEPFFTTKEVGKGTGLGLATVYGIVMQSGGQILVDSEPGHGTSFTIFLPRVREAASPSKEEGPAGRIDSPSRSKTVLLVEDSDLVRELTRNILELAGYNVLEADSPEDAIGICESHEGEIHLLLTDVVMPGMSGRDLSDRLRPVRPGMKVLYMSGYAGEAIVDHGILDHGIHFIPKPFSPAAMVKKIQEVLTGD